VEAISWSLDVSGSLACQTFRDVVYLLVMFTKQRGTRNGIYDCDRRGGFAVLSSSVQGGWIVKRHDRGGKIASSIYRVFQSLMHYPLMSLANLGLRNVSQESFSAYFTL
jgi:hypothetical protein